MWVCARDTSVAWNPDTTCGWMVQTLPAPEPGCFLCSLQGAGPRLFPCGEVLFSQQITGPVTLTAEMSPLMEGS